jgi:putative membrane protein
LARILPNFLIRWAITAAAVAVATWIVPGIRAYPPHPVWSVLVVALVLGLINAFIRPVLYALSCGLIVVTLGLFTLVINGLLLWLASYITSDGIGLEYHVDGFWTAVLGALIVGIVSIIVSLFVREPRRR